MIFDDYAVIRPISVGSRPTLRLERHSEVWYELYPHDDDPSDPATRTVCEDVSILSDEEVMALVDKLHREVAPEDFEVEESS